VNKRADSKKVEQKAPITVNFFSNNKVNFDGKYAFYPLAVVLILYALVTSGSESETHFNFIRLMIEALLGL